MSQQAASLLLSVILQDSSSSSSSDDSDTELLILSGQIKSYDSQPKIKDYVQKLVPSYSDVAFQSHFRMDRSSIQMMCDVISADYYKPASSRAQVPIYTVVLLTVWYMANMESFRSVADRFDLNKGHAHTLMMFAAKLINKNIKLWISWPTGERAQKNMEDFNNIPGNKLKGIFGCLDGSHFRICKSQVDNSYINRHQYPSINLQAICDSKKKFLYVFSGWPGSAHDSRVWTKSPLHNDIERKKDDMLPPSSYIISDSATPGLKHLLK
uniref:Nuclease HARBI1 n=1 Tax=Cacopsylla melanoneura TaxID=428564 RepID=A0A8D9BI24_9HEMI